MSPLVNDLRRDSAPDRVDLTLEAQLEKPPTVLVAEKLGDAGHAIPGGSS